MATAQEYYIWVPLRGGHLSCHFLTKAPLTCQSDFNDQNKNICKGKMFWLTRQATGVSGIVYFEYFSVSTFGPFLNRYACKPSYWIFQCSKFWEKKYPSVQSPYFSQVVLQLLSHAAIISQKYFERKQNYHRKIPRHNQLLPVRYR